MPARDAGGFTIDRGDAVNASIMIRLGTVLLAATLPRFVAAETLPASVAACAAVTDVLQRLACYDREVSQYTQRPPAVSASAASPASAASVPPVAADAPVAAGAPAAIREADTRHWAARIVGIEGRGDDIVVRLDNGQVWEQVQRAEATLGLRNGDRVTIDKGIGTGTYWLAGPSQAVMQVKRNQ